VSPPACDLRNLSSYELLTIVGEPGKKITVGPRISRSIGVSGRSGSIHAMRPWCQTRRRPRSQYHLRMSDTGAGNNVSPPGPPSFASQEHRQALEEHYSSAFGVEPRIVLHEAQSFGVHVDTYVYEATDKRPFLTLATIGMSARAMRPPEGLEEFTHAECLIYVDADWDIDSTIGPAPDEMLRDVARIAHVTDSWIFDGHTIEAREGQPLVPGTLLTDILVRWAPEPQDLQHFVLPNGSPCHFLWAVPITPAECYVVRTKGSHRVTELLDTDSYRLLDVDRACLVSPESRPQRRARKAAQKTRARMPRLTTVQQIPCGLHDECIEGHA
jgi:hypothetical protein